MNRIKSKEMVWKIIFNNFYANSAKGARGKARTASVKNQQSKWVDPNLTWRDLKRKFEEQGERCYWCGVRLDPNNNYIKNHPFALSVDRLDSNGGYTYDNIVISSRLFNLGRGPFSAGQFRPILNKVFNEIYERMNNGSSETSSEERPDQEGTGRAEGTLLGQVSQPVRQPRLDDFAGVDREVG